MMEERDLIKEFLALTNQALSEENDEKFIEILTQRDNIFNLLRDFGSNATWVSEDCLKKEEEILRRLGNIKKKILEGMENLSKKEKLLSAYRPKFPFPPMPAFFEKEE